MNPSEYVESYSNHLISQYKLYVEMADRISQRREQSNRFYVGVLAGMITFIAVLTRLDISVNVWAVVFLVAGLLGSGISVVWLVNIQSYRALSTAKFAVINELEKSLPAQGFARGWNLLQCSDSSIRYLQLTRVEQIVPGILGLIFVGLMVYALVQLSL